MDEPRHSNQHDYGGTATRLCRCLLGARIRSHQLPTQDVQVTEGMAWRSLGINKRLDSPLQSQFLAAPASASISITAQHSNPFLSTTLNNFTSTPQQPSKWSRSPPSPLPPSPSSARPSPPPTAPSDSSTAATRSSATASPPPYPTLPQPDSNLSPKAPTTSSGSAASPTPSPSVTSPSTASTRRRRSSSAAPPTPSRTTSSASPTRSPRTAASRRRQTDADMAAARTTAALPRSRVWRMSGEGVGFGGDCAFL